jgi:hypothetical protein
VFLVDLTMLTVDCQLIVPDRHLAATCQQQSTVSNRYCSWYVVVAPKGSKQSQKGTAYNMHGLGKQTTNLVLSYTFYIYHGGR